MAKKKVNISGFTTQAAKILAVSDEKDGLITTHSLKNKSIAISVSDSEEYEELGFSKYHQRDITIELTRYLLANEAHLLYGGDLRDGGYTKIFSELSFQYRAKEEHDKTHFTNYFGWPIYNLLENSDVAEYKKNRVGIQKCAPPKEVPPGLRTQFVKADSIENKLLWALSMSKMREEMTRKTAARIFIGGALSNYKGFYPGIIEEGILTLRSKPKQPLFLIGAFGGATRIMIRAINGESGKILVDEVFERFPDIKELYKHAGDKPINKRLVGVFNDFRKIGIKGLGSLNGLTREQNEVLFETKHFHEMIYYVLIGLKRKL